MHTVTQPIAALERAYIDRVAQDATDPSTAREGAQVELDALREQSVSDEEYRTLVAALDNPAATAVVAPGELTAIGYAGQHAKGSYSKNISDDGDGGGYYHL